MNLAPPDARVILDTEAAAEAMSPTARRMFRRRRRAALLAVVGLGVGGLLVGQVVRGNDPTVVSIVPAASALPAATPTDAVADRPPADAAEVTPTKGVVAASAFKFVRGDGPVLGTAGPLRRFTVAVERSLGEGGGRFADEVDRVLGDRRSWIGSRDFRLQRVPRSAAAEFTVYLASARTFDRMCEAGGLDSNGHPSCRQPGQVIINADRWNDAVPDGGAARVDFRAYAINHEVGHEFGYGHEACPGKGEPAPVMQQQTDGLQGCLANSWPYLSGNRYSGDPVG